MYKNKKFKIITFNYQLNLHNNNNKVNKIINFNYQIINSLNNRIQIIIPKTNQKTILLKILNKFKKTLYINKTNNNFKKINKFNNKFIKLVFINNYNKIFNFYNKFNNKLYN